MGKLVPTLDGLYLALSWHQKEAIDDLRDDLQDETGVRVSRSDLVGHILKIAYQADGLTDHLARVVPVR